MIFIILRLGYAQEEKKVQNRMVSEELVAVLNQLKHQKEVQFLYEAEEFQGLKVNGTFDPNDDITNILTNILPPLSLSFKQIGRRNFVIRKEEDEAVSNGQYISGVMLNAETGVPLIGGTVRTVNNVVGTLTDEQGFYQLQLPAGTHKVIFSYVGYYPQTIEVEASQKLHVQLQEIDQTLDAIVITAVGLEAQKQELTYSVDQVYVKDLAYSNETNLVSALSGKVPGVQIQSSSGSPGASAGIVIRGYRSINGQNKPLFILDGIPIDNRTIGNSTTGVDVSNRLIDLNPADYESISILKGPAATALYGLRAANGAIVIKSKRGQKGAPKVNYRSRLGIQEVSRLPARQTVYAQGKFIDGSPVYKGPESSVNTSYGPPITQLEFDGDNSYPYDRFGRLVPTGTGNGQSANIYDPIQTFFVKGQTVDQHLAISGGIEKLNYYASIGHYHETGIVPLADFKRTSLKFITEIQLHPKFTLENTTYLVRSGGNRMKRGAMFSGVPLGLFRNPISFDIGNGKKGMDATKSADAYLLSNGEQRAYRGNGRYDNPFWTVNLNPFKDRVDRLIEQVGLTYTISEKLQLIYRLGLDIYQDDRLDGFDIHSGTHRKGQIRTVDISATNISSNFLLLYNTELNENWYLKTTLGHNFNRNTLAQKILIGKELKKAGFFHINNAIDVRGEENMNKRELWGLFAEAQLSYKCLLYLSFTLRNDWSSTLASKKNQLLYPSASMAFAFSNLFPKSLQDHLNGKIRLSYSKTGNDAQPYLTDNYFDFARTDGDDLLPATVFPAYGVNALERSVIQGNPDLRAESTHAFEIGTELFLLNYRLWIEANFYYTKTYDQVVMLPVSTTTGFRYSPQNAGIISNKGLELSLGGNLIQQRKWKWDLQFNYTHINSLVNYLAPEAGDITLASFTAISSMAMVGQPYGVLAGTAYLRDEMGRKIIGKDGFPLLNPEQVVIGDPNPDAFIGLRNKVSYKNFHLNLLLDIRIGGDIWNGTKGVMSFLGTSAESGEMREIKDYIFDGVTEDGTINQQPVDFANPANGMDAIWWRRYGFLGLAEKYIESGSWIRLRELSCSWDIHLKKWSRGKLDKLEVALSARNLWLLTKYSGIDPDSNLRGDSPITGWDYFNLPNTRSYSLNLNFLL